MSETRSTNSFVEQQGAGHIGRYETARFYPFSEAAYTVGQMLKHSHIKTPYQLSLESDSAKRIREHVEKLTDESGIRGMRMKVIEPFGTFYGQEKDGASTVLTIEKGSYLSDHLSGIGRAEGLAVVTFKRPGSKVNEIGLGVAITASLTYASALFEGHLAVPFHGNDLTILPPVELN